MRGKKNNWETQAVSRFFPSIFYPSPYSCFQDPQLASLLFPAVIAAFSSEHLWEQSNYGTGGQKSTLDCLLDAALENPTGVTLEELLLNLIEKVEIRRKEEDVMQELCATLKSILVTHFPNAMLEPFGSIPR